ncbi:hypothetical protein LUD75_01800 [Epilithonimonas sp. JDS]|uniref:FG-GAP repeat protein n=1 Tax=Epilithonimonas sp. JDS TaxID=2902797 RepID=UPI001E4E7C36|nr:FG-GAP repeat protein [Epilithonimonas sp. JDS]MCD9853421.1 hypothetical protein [Epilithonimonas sp. JDS]
MIYFKKAIELYPKGYLGYLNAGACLQNLPVDLGDENQSGAFFKKAYELAPKNPNAIFNYANVLNQFSMQGLDNQDLKENLYAQAVQSKQDEPLAKLQFAKTLHQKAYDEPYNETLFNNALTAYDEAIKQFPGYADNYKNKARLLSYWSRQKNYPENRVMKKQVCENIDQYKNLLKGDYDTELDRMCIYYPELKSNTVKNYTELLSGWEEIALAKGDLNKDGFDDIVLIARAVNPKKK